MNTVLAEKNTEPVNITFGQSEYTDNTEQDNVDKTKYTMVDVDHLDEDEVIAEQKYCLLSFMSPEGIMNCNVRAVKFRGAFPTLEAAEKYAAKLEQQDAYFKIFVGETGKWLDCDPNSKRVEREKTSNPQHQQMLDAQAKQRMTQINELAGRTKQLMDKNKNGKKDMIDEKKKDGAAQELVDKKRQRQNTNNNDTSVRKTSGHSKNNLEDMKERMRKKLAEKQNKERLAKLDNNETDNTNLNNKIKVVSKKSSEVENNKTKLETVDRNIEKIKELMAQRKTTN